jgi:hypothetical protein
VRGGEREIIFPLDLRTCPRISFFISGGTADKRIKLASLSNISTTFYRPEDGASFLRRGLSLMNAEVE